MLNVYVIIGVIFVPVYARCTNVHTADLLKSGEEAGCGIQHLLQRCQQLHLLSVFNSHSDSSAESLSLFEHLNYSHSRQVTWPFIRSTGCPSGDLTLANSWSNFRMSDHPDSFRIANDEEEKRMKDAAEASKKKREESRKRREREQKQREEEELMKRATENSRKRREDNKNKDRTI